jgi:RimJ/RimL family protein N-acetyltransferase
MEVRVSEPFPDHALPRVWHWIQSFRWRVADDFSPQTLEEFMLHWSAHERRRSWAVYRDNEIGGLVTVDPMSQMVSIANCTFKRSFWSQADVTLPALQQVYSEVFGSTPDVHKILQWAFADNAQLLGLMRKLGAEKEATLRQQTRRRGELVDMIAIGLLREEFVWPSTTP